MSRRFITATLLALSVMFFGQACATKKFVRKTIDERVAPLEGRTAELEESVRRNSSAIKEVDDRLSRRIDTVSVKAEEAEKKATEADRKAVEADRKAVAVRTDLVEATRELDTFTVVRTEKVYFKTGRFELSADEKLKLDSIASYVKGRKGTRIEIAGFADRRGGERYNIKLTDNRANEVKLYLFRAHGIDLYRITYIGAGKIDDEARTKEELQENRRVEVRVLENKVVNKSGGNG